MNADRVIEVVGSAFATLPLPEVSLRQAQLADQSMSREISEREWKDAGLLDAGRTWRELGDEELIACDAALAHFDESSFVYYIPAFMQFSVRHCTVEWSHPASSLVGGVVYSLTSRDGYNLARYKRFTEEQRKAVVCFLEYIAEHGQGSDAYDAQKSLCRYWNTDEASKPLTIVP